MVKTGFLYETLGGMKNLTMLRNEMLSVNLEVLLKRAGTQFNNLRELEISGPFGYQQVVILLKRFPGLERLRPDHLYRTLTTDGDIEACDGLELSHVQSRLKELKIYLPSPPGIDCVLPDVLP
ncbi:hypothetical protein BGX23_009118 [Mortierella sp. AD031]|nr:hypothetical protein BGX23_009118 [Mortierella sp. AD031]